MPHRVFSGTAMTAAVSDRRTAASASGSTIAAQKADAPCAKASLNTRISGNNSSTAMKEIAANPSRSLSHRGSSVGFLKERRREPERPFEKVLIGALPPSFANHSAQAASQNSPPA